MNRLTTIVREVRYDGSVFEVRVYLDAWIELFMDGHCFKSYLHGPTTA